MNTRRVASFLVSVSFLVSIDLSAHHGAALYDNAETITLKGPVTQFRFVFPHALVYIATQSDNGDIVEWSGELTTPNRLARGIGPGGTTHAGWTSDTLQPGDVIELTGSPARNGAPSMRILSIVDADGAFVVGGAASDTASRVETGDASAAPPATDSVNLSGMWNYRYSHSWENYAFTAELPPMTPWGRERFEASKPTFGPRGVAVSDTNDPAYQCLPSGTPRIYAHPAPFEIVQTPGRVLIAYEWMNLVRHIYTDGRDHREGRPPSWMGESIGHWEGDTLVVQSVNFNDRTWVDRRGLPHSDQLRVVERIRRSGDDELTIDITVDDPIAYTQPWSARRIFGSVDWRLEESVCLDNQSFTDYERTLIEYEDGSGADFFGLYAQPIREGGVPATPDTEPDAIPYTAEGQRAFDAYVPELNPRVLDDCAPQTMSRVLWTPDPMEVREEDGKLVFHYERGGAVRSIVMNGTPPAANQPNTHLGYSVGRWEGDVLIIETTHMSGGVLSGNARPLSPDARVTERYWREPGSNDLQLEVEIDDPVNYTEAFKVGREFIWAPDEEIRPWVCVNLGPKDTPPDLDGLTRMLEEL